MSRFEVIVAGGGHAGTEAALAAARAGARTLLLTQNIETVGQMSCNPAIGGVGKGHLAREVDALGGCMAGAADRAGIQFRRLNASRGPAVRATRAQADRALYRAAVRAVVENQPNLRLFQAAATAVVVRNGRVVGVRAQPDLLFRAPAVVLTAGTFLGGVIHVGQSARAGGRAGDAPAGPLADQLRELNPVAARLKTGTPPRLDGRAIDFARLVPQPGDDPRPVFSFLGKPEDHPRQVPCHIAATNARVHDIVRAALKDSPMFSGQISGVGPRYCPSIEDKVHRFPDRSAHRVFLEPEGLDCREYYPNGVSTSLPFAAQVEMIRAVAGLENAHITRPGYAIEYDYFDPRALSPSLEARAVGGLFFAGQVNGTTGYEEAAAQGLVAGVNAARRARDLPPWSLSRDQAYIGVLTDDLTSRGVSEPYRMFTSRAESRLTLREDNADLRLTPVGRELGIVDDARWQSFCARRERLEKEAARLHELRINGVSAHHHLKNPASSYADLGDDATLTDLADIAELEARVKYAGYIRRQEKADARLRAEEAREIPPDFDFALAGLSAEMQGVLTRARPANLRQARRIVTPAALAALAAHLRKSAAATPPGGGGVPDDAAVKIFAVINQKGGTGKTTAVINLAAHLAARGRRLLVADMDPQGNATAGAGVARRELRRGMYEALCGIPPKQCIVGTASGRHDILGAKAELAGAEAELPGLPKWQGRLREALAELAPDYDFILIDCPPSLGALTVNALVAAEGALVPMQCEYFALEGLSDLRRTILELRKRWNPALRIVGIARPMLDPRNKLERDISAELDRHFAGVVFKTAVRRNVRVAEAPSYGMPVLTYAPASAGATGYRALGDEFLERFGGTAE